MPVGSTKPGTDPEALIPPSNASSRPQVEPAIQSENEQVKQAHEALLRSRTLFDSYFGEVSLDVEQSNDMNQAHIATMPAKTGVPPPAAGSMLQSPIPASTSQPVLARAPSEGEAAPRPRGDPSSGERYYVVTKGREVGIFRGW